MHAKTLQQTSTMLDGALPFLLSAEFLMEFIGVKLQCSVQDTPDCHLS